MKAILVIDKMPNSCDECEVKCTGYTAKEYAEKGIKRSSWCPLKPIPEGHGDLIDRQALIDNGIKKGFCDWYDEIKIADTIIEADTGETE